jgi:hypothetical protein
MINLIWNAAQQRQIYDARKRIVSKEGASLKVSSQVARLALQVEKLTLITHALWEIVKKDTKRTDEDLVSLMTELDLQDGVLDGKIRKPAQKCSKCGKSYQVGRPSCIYCGTPNPKPVPFEGL